ncbi:hypothetical protein HPP92_001855 [Vanilla planifolia]|uniref:Uncharacterized protein n=1 Tax=Vanilla planifolia TaxID=51239 RepID=A0A835RSD8_VANPL|nr:hypothetical protein HPP92_001855 [Vanilla planifolia]
MASTRSPSPNPSRPSSPNPKSIENESARHKSGALNPTKPCSGSEIPLRNSVSKSPRGSFEQKENERDSIWSSTARARSSSVNSCKGMKGFMAPTISASSKVAANTPRKTILLERNEDSIDSRRASVEEIKPKSVVVSDSEEISLRNRQRIQSFSYSRSHHQPAVTRSPSFSHDGPTESDPSLPPYDPMTNYLSPRPRFLHYKPKPRADQNKDFLEDFAVVGDGRRLEDSFSSSDGSEDSSDYNEGAQSSPTVKEQVTNSSVMKSLGAHLPDQPKPKTYNTRTKLFARSKLIPILWLLIIASFSLPMIDSPILTPSMIKDESIGKLGGLHVMHLKGFLAVAGRNLQGIASRMSHWPTHLNAILTTSLSSTKEIEMACSTNTTVSTSVVQNVDKDFCYNSELELPGQNDPVDESPGEVCKIEFSVDVVDGDVKLWKREKDNFPTYEEGHISFDDLGEKIDKAMSEDVDGKGHLEQVPIELGDEDSSPMNTGEIDSSIGSIVDNQINFMYKEGHESFTAPGLESGKMEEQSEDIDIAISDEVDVGGHPTGFEMVQSHFNNKEDSGESIDLAIETQMMDRKVSTEGHSPVFADTRLMFAVLGMLAVLSLATALIFLFMKKKKTWIASDDIVPYNNTRSVSGNAKRSRNGDYSPFHDLTEVMGDSGPTEMSSSLNTNLSLSQQMRKTTPTHEMQRRESAVSSSTSYGSFTALEKLSSKKGSKDEEVMTPVRRSSRIRNHQVTSP